MTGPTLTGEPMTSPDWIEWNGGECPLPVGTMHERRYRRGAVWGPAPVQPYDFNDIIWGHSERSPDCDIIAYREVKP